MPKLTRVCDCGRTSMISIVFLYLVDGWEKTGHVCRCSRLRPLFFLKIYLNFTFPIGKFQAEIYPSNFGGCCTPQKSQILQLIFEIHSSYIFVCFFTFVFAELLSCWNSLELAFLPIKIKRHLLVLHMQLFDYICIHNIYK